MSERLSIETQRQGGLVYLRLSGVVDEDNRLERLGPTLDGAAAVAIDTAQVTRINSCGVRDWVNWLARLERAGLDVVLVNCSVHIVEQINMVHNFIGGGRIKSLYAPYYCEDCDRELLEYIEVEEITDPQAIHPACPSCNQATELDHLPEQFFAFLDDPRRSRVPSELSREIAVLGRSLSKELRALDGPRRAVAVGPTPVSDPGPRRPSVAPAAPAPRHISPPQAARETTGPGLPHPLPTPPPRTPLSALSSQPMAPLTPTAPSQPVAPAAGGDFALSPLATVLLVAGIVVVVALMFLLVFRSW